MAAEKKYLKKVVKFGGKNLHLFSLDGLTWSSRKEELETIKERHENEKVSYGGQIKGGPQAKIPTTRPKPTSVQTRRYGSLKGNSGEEGGEEVEEQEESPAATAKPAPIAAKKAPPAKAQPAAKKPAKKPVKETAKAKTQPAPKKRATSKPSNKKVAKAKRKAA